MGAFGQEAADLDLGMNAASQPSIELEKDALSDDQGGVALRARSRRAAFGRRSCVPTAEDARRHGAGLSGMAAEPVVLGKGVEQGPAELLVVERVEEHAL